MSRTPFLSLVLVITAAIALTAVAIPAYAGPDDNADGFKPSHSKAVADDDGSYKIEMDETGRIRVTATSADGGSDVRQFESLADFTHQWPELADKFDGLGLEDGGGDGASPAREQWQEWMKRLRERREARPERPNLPEMPQMPNPGNGSGDGERASGTSRASIGNSNGMFVAEIRADGSLRITATFKGNEPETREFENQAQFEAEWPEVAKQFGEGFKLTPNGVVIRGSSSSGSDDNDDSDGDNQPPTPDQPEEEKN